MHNSILSSYQNDLHLTFIFRNFRSISAFLGVIIAGLPKIGKSIVSRFTFNFHYEIVSIACNSMINCFLMLCSHRCEVCGNFLILHIELGTLLNYDCSFIFTRRLSPFLGMFLSNFSDQKPTTFIYNIKSK